MSDFEAVKAAFGMIGSCFSGGFVVLPSEDEYFQLLLAKIQRYYNNPSLSFDVLSVRPFTLATIKVSGYSERYDPVFPVFEATVALPLRTLSYEAVWIRSLDQASTPR